MNIEKAKESLETIKMFDNYGLLREHISTIENVLNDYEEDKKELIAEQHRLFYLAKEQENELKELKEFAKIVATKGVDSLQAKSCKDDYDYNNCIFRRI